MRRAEHSIFAPGAFLAAAGRQVRHIVMHKMLMLAALGQAPVREVWFHPEMPHPYTVVYRMCHLLGIRMRHGMPTQGLTRHGRLHCLAFLWQDDTFVAAQSIAALINGRCTDISKLQVERVHQSVFGYGLAVDPTAHDGWMVCKSDLNGAHDGRLVHGPLNRLEPGAVYQRLIDNRGPQHLQRDGQVCDMRVTVFGGRPVFAYLKFRPKASRFSNSNSRVHLAVLADLFSEPERVLLAAFCRGMGLDYGEIDVVRDESSQRIHVLDVNKTPLGPPNGLEQVDRKRALALYKAAFIEWFRASHFQTALSASS